MNLKANGQIVYLLLESWVFQLKKRIKTSQIKVSFILIDDLLDVPVKFNDTDYG